jgi:hypothetical protein
VAVAATGARNVPQRNDENLQLRAVNTFRAMEAALLFRLQNATGPARRCYLLAQLVWFSMAQVRRRRQRLRAKQSKSEQSKAPPSREGATTTLTIITNSGLLRVSKESELIRAPPEYGAAQCPDKTPCEQSKD